MSSLNYDDLRRVIKDVMTEREARNQSPEPQEAHADHVCGCKDCLCDTIKKLKETSEIACEGCKLPLGKMEVAKQIDHCPFCGNTKAMKYHFDFETNKPVYG